MATTGATVHQHGVFDMVMAVLPFALIGCALLFGVLRYRRLRRSEPLGSSVTSEHPPGGIEIYRPFSAKVGWIRAVALVAAAAFTAGAVALIMASVRGQGPAIPFSILWFAALGWNAYWWLFRFVIQVEIDADELRWRTIVLRGSVPVAAVRRVRPSAFSRQLAVLEVDGARPLVVWVRYGFDRFMSAVQAAAPLVVVRR